MREVRLGIIGLGNMGKTHLGHVRVGAAPGMKVTALCSPSGKGESLAIDGEKAFRDPQEMMESGLIDAVLIATPHLQHAELGVAALRAGLHVLVEKPLSAHKADCETLNAEAARHPELVYAGMYNQRGDPLYRKVREMVRGGELGKVRRILWDITAWFRTEFYFASGAWRATWKGEGGGVLINQCLHNLDIFQWIFGMPESVTAFCSFGRYHQIEVEDDVTAHLKFTDGSHATILTSTGESPGNNRLEIAGEMGLLTANVSARTLNLRRNSRPMSEYSQSVSNAFGQPDVWDCSIPVPPSPPSQHAVVLKNFAAAILHGEPVFAPAAEGERCVELANAMLLSTWENRTVSLPLDGAAYAARLKDLADHSTFQKKVLDPADAQVSAEDFSKSFR